VAVGERDVDCPGATPRKSNFRDSSAAHSREAIHLGEQAAETIAENKIK
jgi:hypothetical protein